MGAARVPKSWLSAVAVSCLLLAAGCSTESESSEAVDRPPAATPAFDLGGRGTADLGGGWTISHCEGEAPMFCLALDGEDRGVLELVEYRAGGHPPVAGVLDSGGSVADALRALAADFHQVFEEDRPVGCGPGYTVHRFGPQPATVAGLPGVVYGFDGRQDGERVERALQFAAIVDGTVHILAVNAADDGTCLGGDVQLTLSVAELTDLQPALERLVATSRLP